jgi:hypothetical protein
VFHHELLHNHNVETGAGFKEAGEANQYNLHYKVGYSQEESFNDNLQHDPLTEPSETFEQLLSAHSNC